MVKVDVTDEESLGKQTRVAVAPTPVRPMTSHKSHQHLTLTEENKWQVSLLPAMFGREGISYFREYTIPLLRFRITLF